MDKQQRQTHALVPFARPRQYYIHLNRAVLLHTECFFSRVRRGEPWSIWLLLGWGIGPPPTRARSPTNATARRLMPIRSDDTAVRREHSSIVQR